MSPQEFHAYKASTVKKIEAMPVLTTMSVEVYRKVQDDRYEVDRVMEVTKLPSGFLYDGTFIPGGINSGANW